MVSIKANIVEGPDSEIISQNLVKSFIRIIIFKKISCISFVHLQH